MHIRADDQVEVMRGKDKGVRAKVLRVMRDDGKMVVEGVNRVCKHMRKSQKNPRGGRLHKEMPIQLANVRLVCPACGKADAHRSAIPRRWREAPSLQKVPAPRSARSPPPRSSARPTDCE